MSVPVFTDEHFHGRFICTDETCPNSATATALAPVTPPHDTARGERVAPPPNLRALAGPKEDA